MRLVALVALVAACQADPCDGHAGTCIAVEVHGPSSLSIDQFLVGASGAFTLHDAPTPRQPFPSPAALPIAFAVLPGEVAGPFVLTLRARRARADVAESRGEGALVRGQVLRVILDLTPTAPDGGAPDLSRFVDLAGADLAGQACDPLTQAPCMLGQKCVFTGSAVCRADGTKSVASLCTVDFDDDCVRGTQCVLPGDVAPGNGLCEQFCAKDSDCTQPAVNAGATLEPANGPHCFFPIAGAGSPKVCTVACNPVARAGDSGCPTGSVCVYGSNASAIEFTFCDRAASGTDGQPCSSDNRCAPGFNCGNFPSGTHCRAMCRSGTAGDCGGGEVCFPGAGGSPPMFGYCCPSGGC